MIKEPKSIRILTRLCNAIGLGTIRISKRGVPHYVFGEYSACYFCRSKLVRIWTGYATPYNKKLCDCKQWPEAARTIRKLVGLPIQF